MKTIKDLRMTTGVYPDYIIICGLLQVISGYQLPKKKGDKARSILDPYVVVEIVGVPADCSSKKTEWIKNNGELGGESYSGLPKTANTSTVSFSKFAV